MEFKFKNLSVGQISRWRLLRLIFVSAFLLYPILYALHPVTADAAEGVPQILNHQGRLLSASGTLLGGAGTPYCFKFSFYDDATPGGPDNKLWPTGSPTTTTAIVRSGIFNVGIGDTSQGGDALDFDFQSTDATYLNVDVAAQAGGSCAGGDESFETLAPRQRIYSSGYAINASRLSGYTAAQTASGTQIPVLTSGNLVLGGTNPQINATGTNALVLQGGTGTGAIQFFNAANYLSSTGTLVLAGLVTAANINQFLTTTSSPTFAGITVSGPAGLQSFTFTNATGTGNLSVATVNTTGAASLNSLSVTNVSGLAGVTFSNATGTGNIQSATFRTTGAATLDSLSVMNVSGLQGVTFTNATGTGNLEVGTLSTTGATALNSLTVSAVSGLNGITFANATGTGNLRVGTLDTTGAASLNSLTVVGGSGFQEFTFTNATGTGNFQVGTFTATGASSLQGFTFANATGTGNLQALSITSQNIFDLGGNRYVTSTGGSATGPTGSIQFNEGGNFAGSSTFVFSTSTKTLNFYGIASSTEFRSPSGTIAVFRVTGQSTLAAVSAASVSASGNIDAGSFSGGGLTDCTATNSKLLWDSGTQQFQCSSEMTRAFAYNQSSTALALTTATSSLGVDVTITPSTSSSLVLVRLNYKPTALSATNSTGKISLVRGTASTDLLLADNLFGNDDLNTESPGALIQFIDAPATSSPVTYSAWGVWGVNGRMQIDFRSLIAEEVTSSSDLFAGGGPGASPGGPSGSVQYNDNGSFAGSSTFMFDAAGNTLNFYGTASSTQLRAASATIATLFDLSGNQYVTSTSGSTPGGPAGSIQFNDGGIFVGSSTFVFSTSTKTLNFYGIASSTELRASSGTIPFFSFSNATGTTLSITGSGSALQVTAGVSTLQGLTFTNATGTGNFQAGSINGTPIGNTTASTGVFTNATTTGTFTSAGAGLFQNALTVSSGNFTVSSGVSTLQGLTFTNATGTGNLSVNGIVRAGSSNIALNLATGFIDANAITLAPSGSTTATSSVTGLEVASSGLSLVRGCSGSQILKWNTSASQWECADDQSGAGGGPDKNWLFNGSTLYATTSATGVAVGTTTASTLFTVATTSPIFNVTSGGRVGIGTSEPTARLTIQGGGTALQVSSGLTDLQDLTFTNATGTGNIQVATLSTTGAASLNSLTVTNAASFGPFTFTNATGTGNFQVATLNTTGNADFGGILQAGSSDINLTLSTGYINANAITLSPEAATATLFSTSGLEVASSGLSMIRGCGQNQVLKWDLANLQWECQDDISGGVGGGAITVKEGEVTTQATTSIASFSATDFNAIDGGPNRANISIDYASSGITRRDQNETIGGEWNFSGASTSFTGLTFTNATGTGNFQAGSINGTPIGNTTASTGVFTNATTTGTFTSAGAGLFQNALTVSSGNFTVSSGVSTLQGLTFTNATGTGNLSVATLNTTGAASLNSLSVTNVSGLAGLTFTNATGTGNLQSATLNTTGAAVLNSLTVTNTSGLGGVTFTNATGTGNFQVGSINNTPIGGATASTGVFTNATTTGTFTAQGAGRFENGLAVASGVSSFQGMTFLNATGTGNIQAGTLNTTGAASLNSLTVLGASGLQSITFTNATSTGDLHVGGFLRAGTSNTTLTLGTGRIDANAISLSPAATTTAIFSATGLDVSSSSLSLLRGCGTGQILKWNLASVRWECQDDISGSGGGPLTFTNATGTTMTLNGTTTALQVTAGASSLQGLTFANATGTTLSLSSSGAIPLQVVQSGSEPFAKFDDGSGIEQFRVNSGGTVFANGFIAKQMQFSEEFVRTSASVGNDTAGGGTTGLGDTFAWGVGSTGNAHVAVVPSTDAINGAMQLRVTGGTARAGLLYLSAAAGNRNDILDADFRPIIVMKLRPTVIGANNLIFAGMADFTDGVVTDPANGIYFTNASGTTWVGVARTSNVESSATCTGQTISTSTDAYFRIQVNSSSSVEFFMDNNTSDGINTVSCGTVTQNVPTSAMSAEIMNQVRTGGTQPADVLIDYIRINQDDPIIPGGGATFNQPDPESLADIAEEVSAFEYESVEPGDVVSIFSEEDVMVAKSSLPYEKNLYGVITTSPGMILGSGLADSVRIALAGRVPVRVNLQNGPIAVGDWLTSSEEIGVAMRATRNGMVIGRALEAFDGNTPGQDRILATVEVQYYGGYASESDALPTISFEGDDSFLADVAHAVSDLARLATRSVSDLVRVVADAVTAKVGEFIDLFASSFTVTPGGSIALPAGDNQMSGTGFIPARSFDALVSNTKVTRGSKIFVTPLGQTSDPLYIKEKISGVGFRVGVMNAQDSDLAFDWVLFDSYESFAASQPESFLDAVISDEPSVVYENASETPVIMSDNDQIDAPDQTQEVVAGSSEVVVEDSALTSSQDPARVEAPADATSPDLSVADSVEPAAPETVEAVAVPDESPPESGADPPPGEELPILDEEASP